MKSIRILVPSLIFIWIATACSTSYQAFGFTGGYKDVQESEDTWRVRVDGNAMTSQETIEQFTSRRCAELALENGKRYYLVVSQSTETLEGIFAGAGTPFGKATIKMLGQPGEGENARDALQVLKETHSAANGKLSARAAKAMKEFQP